MARGVVLVGLMGAGKTTVGRLVATRLGLPFVDLDARIEADAGRPIPEIFAVEGEAAFRDRESAAIRALAGEAPMVVATGGGAPILDDNWTVLRSLGLTVWLDLDPVRAAERAARQGGRPLLIDVDPVARMQALHAARAGRYAEAELRLDATRPPAVNAEAILDALRRAP